MKTLLDLSYTMFLTKNPNQMICIFSTESRICLVAVKHVYSHLALEIKSTFDIFSFHKMKHFLASSWSAKLGSMILKDLILRLFMMPLLKQNNHYNEN